MTTQWKRAKKERTPFYLTKRAEDLRLKILIKKAKGDSEVKGNELKGYGRK